MKLVMMLTNYYQKMTCHHEVIGNKSNHSQPQEKSQNGSTPIINLELIKSIENLVEVKQLNISPFESVLIWPLTPERKGTRITERIPFVISSQKWQTLHEEKEKKRTIEEEQDNKKRRDLKINK